VRSDNNVERILMIRCAIFFILRGTTQITHIVLINIVLEIFFGTAAI